MNLSYTYVYYNIHVSYGFTSGGGYDWFCPAMRSGEVHRLYTWQILVWCTLAAVLFVWCTPSTVLVWCTLAKSPVWCTCQCPPGLWTRSRSSTTVSRRNYSPRWCPGGVRLEQACTTVVHQHHLPNCSPPPPYRLLHPCLTFAIGPLYLTCQRTS